MGSKFSVYKQRVAKRLEYYFHWSKDDAMPWCNSNIDYIRTCMLNNLTTVETAKLFDDARKADENVKR